MQGRWPGGTAAFAQRPPSGSATIQPELVFTAHDLGVQLDRLRRNAVDPQGRVASLDRLSSCTDIPRSTLHTYLSGRSLPSVVLLDRIVLALGVGLDEASEWGLALDRARTLLHSTRVRSPRSAGSDTASLLAAVTRSLPPGPRRDLGSTRFLSVSEHVVLGCHRLIARIDVRWCLVANVDGVAASHWTLFARPGLDTHGVTLVPRDGCRRGRARDLADPEARTFELAFPEALRAGQTHRVDFSVDYERAWPEAPGAAVPPATEAGALIPQPGAAYELEVVFDPTTEVDDVRQIYQTTPAGSEERCRDLRVTATRTAHMYVAEARSGCHGIRWSWA